ncbi:MAG: hypothetical protein LUI14_10925 [Lachnospiraceae bacterium]|nr:hypothetical protein [Lachnospiraceae bacterium]
MKRRGTNKAVPTRSTASQAATVQEKTIGNAEPCGEGLPGTAEQTLADCPSCKGNCHAYRAGKCIALEKPDFGGGPCPFYRDGGEAREQRVASMEALIAVGKLDLVTRYYGSCERFLQILAAEKAGMDSHAFDVIPEEAPVSGQIQENGGIET